MRIWISILVAGLCSGVSSAVFAAEGREEQAKAVYEEGKLAFFNERFMESADKFRKAYELKPAWRILYNIGQAEAAAKRYGLALEAFEQYLAEGGDEVVEERQDAVMKEIARLRNLVGYIKVTAPSEVVVSHPRVPLEQGADMYRRFAAREPGVLKAAFVP